MPDRASRATKHHDEHSQTDILTSGINLAPAFPFFEQWQWEFVTRYSGATVPDSHGVPGRLAVDWMVDPSIHFKEQLLPTLVVRFCQEVFPKIF